MNKANVFELKARLSELLERAASGERIVICRHNKPIAELGPVASVRTEPRPIGPLAGRPTFDVPASFFEPMTPADLDLWEGLEANSSPARRASRVAESRQQYGTSTPRSRRS